MTRIVGVDPGSRITGFGVIAVQGRNTTYITSGCIRMGNLPFPERLQEIFTGLTEIIRLHQPSILAIEQVFVCRNVDSALKLGQARGAAIVAAMQQNLSVHEYTATQVKQAIVGHGHAQKTQVQHMVRVLLNLAASPQADAADALAIALCHAQQQGFVGL